MIEETLFLGYNNPKEKGFPYHKVMKHNLCFREEVRSMGKYKILRRM